MKRTLIITLLLLVAAFSFGQTNSTFNNLDVRNTTKLRGLIYPFGAVATSPINTAVHEIAMINNTTFALCRMDFKEFADSIANYLNPIIGTHWYTVSPDTIKTIYNVVVDSSFFMRYRNWTLGYDGKIIIPTDIESMSGGYYNAGTGDKSGFSIMNGSVIGKTFTCATSNGDKGSGLVLSTDYLGSDIPYATIMVEDTTFTGSVLVSPYDVRLASKEGAPSDDCVFNMDTTGISIYTDNFIEITCDSTVINSDVKINGDLNVSGQIKYDYIHIVAYTSGGSYTPNTVSNVEFKLTPTFTTAENDGFTFAGDTVTIVTPGDYMVQFSTVFQGANGDDWLFKCRKNGTAITSGNLALTTTGAGNYCSVSWFWYLPGLAAGDDISFSVTNEGANNDPTFRSVKIYVDKKPE